MLTIFFIFFAICYFGRSPKNDKSEERRVKTGWNLLAWILIILVVLHGC